MQANNGPDGRAAPAKAAHPGTGSAGIGKTR